MLPLARQHFHRALSYLWPLPPLPLDLILLPHTSTNAFSPYKECYILYSTFEGITSPSDMYCCPSMPILLICRKSLQSQGSIVVCGFKRKNPLPLLLLFFQRETEQYHCAKSFDLLRGFPNLEFKPKFMENRLWIHLCGCTHSSQNYFFLSENWSCHPSSLRINSFLLS